MNTKLKSIVVAVTLSSTALYTNASYASGFLADVGQFLGILTPQQAAQADRGWAQVRQAVPGLAAAEDRLSAGVQTGARGLATYYGGPLAPVLGDALISQQHARLQAERRAALYMPGPQAQPPVFTGYTPSMAQPPTPMPQAWGYRGMYSGGYGPRPYSVPAQWGAAQAGYGGGYGYGRPYGAGYGYRGGYASAYGGGMGVAAGGPYASYGHAR